MISKSEINTILSTELRNTLEQFLHNQNIILVENKTIELKHWLDMYVLQAINRNIFEEVNNIFKEASASLERANNERIKKITENIAKKLGLVSNDQEKEVINVGAANDNEENDSDIIKGARGDTKTTEDRAEDIKGVEDSIKIDIKFSWEVEADTWNDPKFNQGKKAAKDFLSALQIIQKFIIEQDFVNFPERMNSLSIEDAYLCGRILFAGFGVPKNIKLAKALFQRVAMHHVPIEQQKEPAGMRFAYSQHFLACCRTILSGDSFEMSMSSMLLQSSYERGVEVSKAMWSYCNPRLYGEREYQTLKDTVKRLARDLKQVTSISNWIRNAFLHQYGLYYPQSVVSAKQILENVLEENYDNARFACPSLRQLNECNEHLFLQNNLKVTEVLQYYRDLAHKTLNPAVKIQVLLILSDIIRQGKFGVQKDEKHVQELKKSVFALMKASANYSKNYNEFGRDLLEFSSFVEDIGIPTLVDFLINWVNEVNPNEAIVSENSERFKALTLLIDLTNRLKYFDKISDKGNFNSDQYNALVDKSSERLKEFRANSFVREAARLEAMFNNVNALLDTKIKAAEELVAHYRRGFGNASRKDDKEGAQKWYSLLQEWEKKLQHLREERRSILERTVKDDLKKAIDNYAQSLKRKDRNWDDKYERTLEWLIRVNEESNTEKSKEFADLLNAYRKLRMPLKVQHYRNELQTGELEDKIFACRELIRTYEHRYQYLENMDGDTANHIVNYLEGLKKEFDSQLKANEEKLRQESKALHEVEFVDGVEIIYAKPKALLKKKTLQEPKEDDEDNDLKSIADNQHAVNTAFAVALYSIVNVAFDAAIASAQKSELTQASDKGNHFGLMAPADAGDAGDSKPGSEALQTAASQVVASFGDNCKDEVIPVDPREPQKVLKFTVDDARNSIALQSEVPEVSDKVKISPKSTKD